MKNGLDYPILLYAPKNVPLFLEEFDSLSVMGLCSFFCNYPAAIAKRDNSYEIYLKEERAWSYYSFPRFNGIKWYYAVKDEIVYCTIPLEHPLVKIIINKFSHLILK